MAHPTISRYHAVLQYNPLNNNSGSKGWYVYDQNSTHGTFLNKNKILPMRYVLVKPGFMLKFGGSTRNYILNDDQNTDDDNDMTITDMINKKQEIRDLMKKKEEAETEQGINWGMSEDADEATDLTENPFAMTNNEELFLDDPKKTLRGFFEREGLDLVYNVEDKGAAHFTCRIELPIDDANGKAIAAEYSHHGKKKEVVVQCALEACRILDRLGMLRQSNHEPRKRKQENSDSDDDFLDRTGDVERKRLKKNLPDKKSATYEDLLKQETELMDKIKSLQTKLDKDKLVNTTNTSAHGDDLDDFMSGLTDTKLDNLTKRRMMFEIKQLQDNVKRVQKLIKIAAPNKLPDLQIQTSLGDDMKSGSDKKKLLPLYGKRPCFKKKLEVKQTTVKHHEDNSKDTEEEHDSPDESTSDVKCNEDVNVSQIDVDLSQSEDKTSVPVDNIVTNKNSLSISPKTKTNLSNKSQRHRFRNRTKDERSEDDSEKVEKLGEKYNTWVPPADQTGDGKTKLNDKFGY